ncbi:MAG TPA: four helix bundle protein [Draconibacterium sp.]|nr:four helix bundle protein [Draconibacterium sp.]
MAERLFLFAVRTIKFLRNLPNEPEFNNIRFQLSKSSTSSGANYEEAQAASSRNDFIYKNEISLKEMRESNYWLRIIDATVTFESFLLAELRFLIEESAQLKNILGSIVKNSKNNIK